MQEPEPSDVLAMTMPNGAGTHHAPCIWQVAHDDAITTLEQIAQGTVSWGMLFWVPLMQNGGDEAVIDRWKELVLTKVADNNRRNDLAYLALIFVELTTWAQRWQRLLKDFNMRESQLANQIRTQGRTEGRIEMLTQWIVRVLRTKFNAMLTNEMVQTIHDQEDVTLLDDWLNAAIEATTLDDFLAVMRHG